MPGFHILSQMPAQHNKIKVPVEELSMQRPSELKQDFDWYYTNKQYFNAYFEYIDNNIIKIVSC